MSMAARPRWRAATSWRPSVSLQSEREEMLALYERLGFATVPLVPRGKRPLRRGWQVPSRDAWRDAPADANVGILCGAPSGGLVVLDFDTHDGPHDVFGMEPRELAVHTLVVRTTRGWHVYARHDPAPTTSPRPGLDIRGEGSQVVAPPSVHPSGAAYTFVAEPRRVAALSELTAPEDVFGRTRPGEAEASDEVAVAQPGSEPDWARADEWVALQSAKLQAAWKCLRSGEVDDEFDRSRADFAVARCLWEGGWSAAEIATVLLALPGSKAAERGEEYARKTAARASMMRRV